MKKRIFIIVIFIIISVILVALLYFFNTIPHKQYSNSDFNIETYISSVDKDNDGIDDQTDILNNVRTYIAKKPKYKSKYYDGGYPTDEYRVCTDIIWYALKNAGYDFKTLIDEDIKNNKDEYDEDVGDTNIDFRRVRNIKVYLDRNALKLANDSDFNPGDIVVYKKHIAIVSDKVNSKNENYILHQHMYQAYEYDGLFKNEILGHYRWRLNDGKK